MRIHSKKSIWKKVIAAGPLAVLLLLSLPTSSTARKKPKLNKEKLRKELIWPLPPDLPRIRWLDQIVFFEEIQPKRKKSWFERIAGAVKDDPHRKLRLPWAIVTDDQGRIFVADPGSQGIVVFDRKNKKVDIWGLHRGGSGTNQPVGLAVDDDGGLFASDPSTRYIFKYSSEGVPVAAFGREKLLRPTGLALDRKRHRLYVADSKGHRIAIFDSRSYKLLKYIGEYTESGEPGKFAGPVALALDARGYLYVTDAYHFRVQIFNRRGRFVRAFGEAGTTLGSFARPKGIALDSEGHIYVVDASFGNFQIFDQEGNLLLFVCTFGARPGELFLPAGIHIDEQDRIYISEQMLGRLQIFQHISQPNQVVRKEVIAGKQ